MVSDLPSIGVCICFYIGRDFLQDLCGQKAWVCRECSCSRMLDLKSLHSTHESLAEITVRLV